MLNGNDGNHTLLLKKTCGDFDSQESRVDEGEVRGRKRDAIHLHIGGADEIRASYIDFLLNGAFGHVSDIHGFINRS